VSWDPFDERPGRAILDALIEINAKLADIRRDVGTIRRLFEEDDGEEEEDDG
jgi:hypothetical protein